LCEVFGELLGFGFGRHVDNRRTTTAAAAAAAAVGGAGADGAGAGAGGEKEDGTEVVHGARDGGGGGFGLDGVVEVRTIDAASDDEGVRETELRDDVALDMVGGGGADGNNRHFGEALLEEEREGGREGGRGELMLLFEGVSGEKREGGREGEKDR
jgi:hypothetical protein